MWFLEKTHSAVLNCLRRDDVPQKDWRFQNGCKPPKTGCAFSGISQCHLLRCKQVLITV